MKGLVAIDWGTSSLRMARLDAQGRDETRYLGDLMQIAESGVTVAERLLEAYHGPWKRDLRRAFDERMKRVLIDGQDLHAALLEVERDWTRSLDASAAVGLDAIPRPSPLNNAGGSTP